MQNRINLEKIMKEAKALAERGELYPLRNLINQTLEINPRSRIDLMGFFANRLLKAAEMQLPLALHNARTSASYGDLEWMYHHLDIAKECRKVSDQVANYLIAKIEFMGFQQWYSDKEIPLHMNEALIARRNGSLREEELNLEKAARQVIALTSAYMPPPKHSKGL